MLVEQDCRGQQKPGEQVEGSNTEFSGAGGGGWREWTLFQVERVSKTERGGKIGCKNSGAYQSNGGGWGGGVGGVSTRRVTGKDPEDS